jgi:aspartate aminotransferase
MPTPTPSPDWLDRRVRALPDSPTLAMNELMGELTAAGREVYRLGFGQSPFPIPAPVVEALRRHAAEKDYLPVRGLPALRQAVVEHVERHLGLRYAVERVLVSPGTKELLFLTQLALDAEVLIPSPSWVSYAPQAHLAGRSVIWLPTRRTHRWHLDPSVLRDHCHRAPSRPRVLVLNYPNNPNGATMPPATLQAIATVARTYGVLIVADEIYGLVDHAGTHTSIATFYPEGTVVSTGLSKWCGAGGWRLGTFVIPEQLDWLADALATLASETYSCVSAPIQHAAVTAFRGGPEIEVYLHRVRRILVALGRHAARRLTDAGLDLDPPAGGFYLFPDAAPFATALASRGITTGAAFCDQLLQETGVALLPGSAFGRPPEELTFRLSYVDFDGAAALEACARTPEREPLGEAFLQAHCGRVLEGVELLAEWVAAPAGQPV